MFNNRAGLCNIRKDMDFFTQIWKGLGFSDKVHMNEKYWVYVLEHKCNDNIVVEIYTYRRNI